MYPRASYIIYAAPRSGSTLLCEALRMTNVAGRPGEYFTPAHAEYYSECWNIPLRDGTRHLGEDYFKYIYATTTSNGVFGTKIIWELFPYCLDQIRKLEGMEKLSNSDLVSIAFPQHRAIMIMRSDKVRQAISLWKAKKTNVWWHFGENPKKEMAQELEFDFEGIEKYRQSLVNFEQQMQQYFSDFGIEPFSVVYEEFIVNYKETTLRLLDYLDIPVPRDLELSEPLLQKQADEQTEAWVQQYYHMKQEQERVVV